MEPTSSATENDVVWELRRDDDGFVYKRNKSKKRRLDVDDDEDAAPPPPSSAADEEAEARRREWKEKALLKLKAQYRAEIEQWEILMNRLKAMEEKTSLIRRRRRLEKSERDQTASFGGNGVVGNGCSESVLDELLLQAEAQESIISDVSCLCDTVEAMCRAEEDDVAQSLIDLPIWGSPRELMRSLCDE